MSQAPTIDERSRQILKTLIERYIFNGQPVGSQVLAQASDLKLSPATIRSIMGELEQTGFIASPHTSAGRIPTPKGYRFFVDAMLTTSIEKTNQDLQHHLAENDISASLSTLQAPQTTITNAADILSHLSQYVGVVLAPKRNSVFKQIEFVSLAPRRILLIIVAPDGDLQNRIIHTEIDYTESQLVEASNYLTRHYAGKTMDEVRKGLQGEIEHLRSEIAQLMHAAVHMGSDPQEHAAPTMVVSGEAKLLAVNDLATDLTRLRRAFDLFEKKAQLLNILENSSKADGIRIFIGGENPDTLNAELSIVAAPYQIDNHVVGTLAVIGPTRMPYTKMVHIVDITSKLLGNALSAEGLRA